MSDPRVSVVIPTHNRSGPLQTALAGLRAQTLPREEFEVIVVDDASSDDTPAVLEAAAEPVGGRAAVVVDERDQLASCTRPARVACRTRTPGYIAP